jgi:glycosyltransferase involved in cell wall biosynthesis
MTTVRILAPYYPPAVAGGGPVRTLEALTRTAPEDLVLEVVTRDRDLGAVDRLDVPRSTVTVGNHNVRFLDTRGPLGVLRLAAVLRGRPAPDLLYLNSVFDARFGVLPVASRWCGSPTGTPLLVAPRGEFDPGALALKPKRKRQYLALARRFGLFRDVTWHASTELEATHIRRAVGDDADIVVRENETSLPLRAERTPMPACERLELVTVGRISPKKRTHLVIEALAGVTRPVRLVVVGPVDDVAYARRCSAMAAALPPHVRVDFVGTQPHGTVRERIRTAHAMVTATAGENFGHTIPEALSVGRPVLLSDTTPWSSRVESGGGEVVSDDDWAATIDRWATFPVEDLDERARQAVSSYDAWRSETQAPHVFELMRPRLR